MIETVKFQFLRASGLQSRNLFSITPEREGNSSKANHWICVGWFDAPSWENEWGCGKIIPTPKEIRVPVRPGKTRTDVLNDFRKSHPSLRNHTVHADTEKLSVRHRGPGNYPICETFFDSGLVKAVL